MTNNGCHIEKVAIQYLSCRPWLSCFGHNLNLTVSKTIDKTEVSMDRALAVCPTINCMFSHSWRRELQNSMGLLSLTAGLLKGYTLYFREKTVKY